MITIKRYSIWKDNRIIKLSDDKGTLVKFIQARSPEEQGKMWLAQRSGATWVSEPLSDVQTDRRIKETVI